MSFLDSILNEISGANAPSVTPGAPAPRPRDPRPDIQKERITKREPAIRKDAGAHTEGPGTNGHTVTTQGPKRKASGDLSDSRSKLVKQDDGNTGLSRRSSASSTPPATARPYKGTAGLDRSKVPTRATKRTATITNPVAAAPAPIVKPNEKPPSSSANPTAVGTQAVLKKGSYAEMLARAKAASSKTYTGIKHKPTEKLKPGKPGPGEKLRAADREKDKKRRLSSAEIQSGGESDRNVEKKRKHTELAYKGTMRAGPTELAYKGTMHMKKPTSSRELLDKRPRSLEPARGSKLNKRKGYFTDEEDEEEEDGGYDVESDLSDMEAAVWEVDEEEDRAARIAREEDRKEQELEARLQREKKAKRDAMLKKLQADAIARSDRRRQMG